MIAEGREEFGADFSLTVIGLETYRVWGPYSSRTGWQRHGGVSDVLVQWAP
jgi:hypothetical protein